MSVPSLALETARALAQHGIAVIPVPPRSKNPNRKGWQNERLTEADLPHQFPGAANLGILTGKPSGGLVDVDLDAPEAIAAGAELLPATDMRHGRPGKPSSHRWYVADVQTKKYEFTQQGDTSATMLVELRSTGCQTIVPPSVHPSGERLTWENGKRAAEVAPARLQAAVGKVAACALLARHWPGQGSRDTAALALTGLLLRGGWKVEATDQLVQLVARLAGDEEWEDRDKAEGTARKLAAGENITGAPTLAQKLRDGERVVKQAREWLGIRPDSKQPLAEDTGGTRTRYRLLTDTEVEAFEPAQGILGDLLFEDSTAYLFGDSDTWKTFIAVSWGLCIATGRKWLDLPVKQGPVVYVPAEAARGIGKRITAWKRAHGVTESVDFFVIPMPVNLLDLRATPELIAAIGAHPRLVGRKPAVIIFDTLARSMDGGDENDTADANRITAAAGALKAEYGCNVLFLHHSGNQFTHRMRGNSAFRGNADTTIRTIAPPLPDGQKRKAGDVITLRSDKAKDDGPFDDLHLTTALQQWTTEAGAPVSSLVVVAAEKAPAVRGELVIMPQSSRTALEQLAKLDAPPTATEWLAATGIAKRTFYDARDELVRRQYVTRDSVKQGAHYSITEAGRKVLGAVVRNECETGATAPDDEAITVRADGEDIYPFAPHGQFDDEDEAAGASNGHQSASGRPCLRSGGWLAPHPDGGYAPCDNLGCPSNGFTPTPGHSVELAGASQVTVVGSVIVGDHALEDWHGRPPCDIAC